MSDLVRLSISLERDLYEQTEAMVRQGGYTNRSEYFRDLLRQALVDRQWQTDEVTVGTVTLVYDHHAGNVLRQLTHLQHDHHDVILASTHVHLDEHKCAEVIIMQGPARTLQSLASNLRKHKGVLHAAIAMSTQGKDL